jgi:uncharacterized protein (TIGR02646 family)
MCVCEERGSLWDVEHFRPKGSVAEDRSHHGYWWLAYTWENLYLSCVPCNQRRKDQPTFDEPVLGPTAGKLDQFPIAGQRVPNPGDYLDDELPLLLDPCRDQPDLHLMFDADGQVWPREGSVRGEETIRVFVLKRKRLRDARKQALDDIGELIEEQVKRGESKERATRAALEVFSRPRHGFSALISAARADPALFGFQI